MPTASFTTRIDADLKKQLEQIARHEDRSASYIANQAIRAFVKERIATRSLVETGLALVDRRVDGIQPDDVHNWLLDEDEARFPEQ